MLPLAKDTYKGAVFTVIASSLLSFLLAGISFETALPYILFFGFHPIVNKVFQEKSVNKFLAYFIKDVWFVGAMLICYLVTDMFITDNEIFEKYMIYIIIFGGSILFIVYDYMIAYFQRAINVISKRLKI